jgi:ribose transport system substrate-binding protein
MGSERPSTRGEQFMKKSVRTAALLLPIMLVAVACGSDEDGASSTEAAPVETDGAPVETDAAPVETDAAPVETDAAPSTDAASPGLAAAQAAVDAASSAPTEIGPTIPLTGVPEKKSVAWLECELPSCLQITPGFEAATEALGWDLQVISVQSFDPAPGFQQAIDAGVDYIALTGTPAALVQTQIDAAKDAGIGFYSCYSTDDPGGEENNIWMQCGDDDGVFATGGLLANWIIADSGGAANTLFVNIPDFPVLVSEVEGAAAVYDENCPDCTYQSLDVTIDQLVSGEVPGAVASKLQANPDINYIHFTFADIPAGVADTLEEAGLLDQVKLTGVDFNATIGLTEIVAGRHAAWTANPKEYAGWLMVDAMARRALEMDNTEERTTALLPTFIVSDAATAEALIPTDGWPGPDGMEDQFMALWGV